jgi:UDP-3-O-[3-hydroxymyristoyl] glucosamine N-acyltransferase
MESFSIKEICKFLECDGSFSEDVLVNKISSLNNADENSISFFANESYVDDLKSTNSKIIILREEDASLWHGHSVIHPNPYLAIAKLEELFYPKNNKKFGINNFTLLGKNTSIATDCYIGPFSMIYDNSTIHSGVVIENNVSIGSHVSIGKNTRIHPNVTVGDYVKIGENCEIFSSASVGTDGFGYAEDESGRWVKIPQKGSVIINDHVDIGSNTVIDRGTLDNTIIHLGVKIDNQVQIGHNCIIEENSIIAGCVGIAGSAHIGKQCKIGGAAMILGHLKIADNTTVSPGTMITKSIKKSGKRYTSITPFFEHSNWLKITAKLKQFSRKL